MNRRTLYTILSAACLFGYLWLAFQINIKANSNEVGVCFFKHTTNIPCPSCGSTRSILSLLNGDINGAFFWNPLGLIILTIMILLPFWILYDLIKRKSSLFRFYIRFEILIKQKSFFIPALLFVAGNWIWNIYKGL